METVEIGKTYWMLEINTVQHQFFIQKVRAIRIANSVHLNNDSGVTLFGEPLSFNPKISFSHNRLNELYKKKYLPSHKSINGLFAFFKTEKEAQISLSKHKGLKHIIRNSRIEVDYYREQFMKKYKEHAFIVNLRKKVKQNKK